jgi:MFS transporter, UMF1 family
MRFENLRPWFRRPILSWVLYDIASSGYGLIIPSVAYAVYYRQIVCGGADICDARWAMWLSLAMVTAGLLAPLLGAIADLGALRHRLFVATTLLCGLATAALYTVQPGAVLFGGLVFFLAQAGFLLATSLYDAYLPSLVPPHQIGRLSGWGWGMGYLGGIGCFLLFWLVQQSNQFDAATEYRFAFLIAAGFLLVLALPALVWLPRQSGHPSSQPPAATGQIIRSAYNQVWQTLRNWRQMPELFRFLLGLYLISDGIVTLISFLSIYLSTQFGLSVVQILQLTLVFNLVAIPATILCGILSDLWSAKSLLRVLIGVWIGLILIMVFSTHPATPILLAVLLGLVLGSTQALCRGLFAQMIYTAQATELFGFNALVSKMSAIVGPLLFGTISSATGNQRLAMAALLLFFGAGGLILNQVNYQVNYQAKSLEAAVSSRS